MYDYDSRNKRERALGLVTKEMCKTLESYGPNATLNFLIGVSNQDYIVNELLPLFPSIATTGEFLSKISTHKVEKDEEECEDE
jgi:hypothetical protein